MNYRNTLCSAAAAVALLSTAACSGGSSTDDGGDDTFSVGIVRFAPSEVTTEGAIKEYVKLAEAAGWEVTTANPDAAVDKAIGAMQDFVQKKVDLIVVGSFDSTTLTSGLRSATEAGIPVASIAGGIADGVTYNLGVANGIEIPDQMIEDMGGEGRSLVLSYTPGPPCQIREKALDEALEDTGITADRQEVTIPGQLESSQRLTTAWLAKNPADGEPLSVWACWDDPALGAYVAIEQAKRTDVKIYGYNGTPAGLRALKEGKIRATSAPDLAAAAKLLFDATPSLVEGGADAEPQDVETPYNLVTSDTIDEYLVAHPGADGS
ncbi:MULTISPECIES: sugar ABC transporter substrate-binding protein [unclassified Nocardioides]|uniref:sugar ABC transporter substrate-binding protein n=1 Tax=unclassified Nocardioides TaxID=2615069 RepID=UPI000703889A|nr:MULTISPECIES: sugar ABC transporter substrate-binding protein [unclassified Nocardioides]KRC48898.1 hypothetical protein ASE19_18475 [Nocardioides sp. Root79]KRC75297.1 hypothetical protein ASE20_20375 [Nocardioides sp. Root240]